MFNPVAACGVPQPGMMFSGVPQPGMMSPGVPQPGMMSSGVPQPVMMSPGVPQPVMMSPGVPQPGMMSSGVPQPGMMSSGVPQPGMMSSGVPQPGMMSPGVPQPGMMSLGMPAPHLAMMPQGVPQPVMMSQAGMQGPPAEINPLGMPAPHPAMMPQGFYAPIADCGWIAALQAEFSKDYFRKLALKLQNDYTNKQIYPPSGLIFNAFNLTPLDQVKVVILGQDPSPKARKAMGLSFSVPMDELPTRSLNIIYKELKDDKNIKEFIIPDHGCLEKWAGQGVLLLNTVLTVEKGKRRSHAEYGWKEFTNAVIKIINNQRFKVVFMLWGDFAATKQSLIDSSKHKKIITSHPSPTANWNPQTDKRFYGSGCFSDANKYLINMGKTPIDWSL